MFHRFGGGYTVVLRVDHDLDEISNVIGLMTAAFPGVILKVFYIWTLVRKETKKLQPLKEFFSCFRIST